MTSRFKGPALVGVAAVLAGAAILTFSNHHNMLALRAKNAAASFPGRSAIVVGGTAGIGHGIALRLAQAQYQVTIVGRNAEAGRKIIDELSAKGGTGHAFIQCDAQLIGNVKALVRDYSASHSSLDVLVVSQGIATIQGYTPTAEGIDQKLAIHYYGRMAFIEGLLPLLRAAPSPKVLSVLSGGVHSPYADFKTDPSLKDHYSLKNAADAAGFYNDLELDALSKKPENSKVAFFHAAPGVVSTNWGTEMPWYIRYPIRAIQMFATSKEGCAEAMCAPIFDASASLTSGFHVINSSGEEGKVTAAHTDDAMAFIEAHTRSVLDSIPQAPASSTASGASSAAAASSGGGGAATASRLS